MAGTVWTERQTDPAGPELSLWVGRLLAECAHPVAAWRVVAFPARMGILLAYFAAAYVTVLAALMALSSTA